MSTHGAVVHCDSLGSKKYMGSGKIDGDVPRDALKYIVYRRARKLGYL